MQKMSVLSLSGFLFSGPNDQMSLCLQVQVWSFVLGLFVDLGITIIIIIIIISLLYFPQSRGKWGNISGG